MNTSQHKITIEMSDRPIEPCRRGRKYRFPFNLLEIGGCFIVKGLRRNTLSPYKCYAEKALGIKLITKTLEDGVGVAVWRIK